MSLTDAMLLEPYRDPKDIWIARRSDGQRGTGTENDPYNGSTIQHPAIGVDNLEIVASSFLEATAVTAVNHGYANFDRITILGASEDEFNETSTIFDVTSNSFKYRMVRDPGQAYGSVGGTKTATKVDTEDELTITSLSNVATEYREAKVTTEADHGFANEDVVVMEGALDDQSELDPRLNGRFVIYGVESGSPRVFRYFMKADAGAANSSVAGDITCARQRFLFDEPLRALNAANVDRVVIRLGPGLFETRGTGGYSSIIGWRMRTGWKVMGSGMNATTLKLVGINDSSQLISAIGAKVYSDRADDAEVSDLTVDCDLAGNPGMAAGAVALIGSHTRIRRVRAIHFGTETMNAECFVLVVGGAHPDLAEVMNCVIQDCVCEHPSGNNARETTVLLVSSGERGIDGIMAHPRGCVLRNNYINCTYSDNEVPIESISFSGGTATVTTKVPHSRNTGDWVAIAGAMVQGSPDDTYFNGTFAITKINDTQFSYAMSGTPPAAPTGEMFADRYPSHLVAVTSLVKKTGDPKTAVLTSSRPHYLKNGGMVSVDSSDRIPGQGPEFYGHFLVTHVATNKVLEYRMNQEPDGASAGFRFSGVSFQAMTNGGIGSIIERNQVEHARLGVYQDTWSNKSITIRNNRFRDLNTGCFNNMGNTSGFKVGSTVNSAKNGEHIATFTTIADHGLVVGQAVKIDAGTGHESYSGYFPIKSVPTSKTFTYLYDMSLDASLLMGVRFGALWQVGRIVIENNVFELNRRISNFGPPTGIALSSSAGLAPVVFVFGNVEIRGNTILHFHEPPSEESKAIRLDNCENGIIENNEINLTNHPTGAAIDFLRSNTLSFFDNRGTNGAFVPGLNADLGRTVDELRSRILDATLLAI